MITYKVNEALILRRVIQTFRNSNITSTNNISMKTKLCSCKPTNTNFNKNCQTSSVYRLINFLSPSVRRSNFNSLQYLSTTNEVGRKIEHSTVGFWQNDPKSGYRTKPSTKEEIQLGLKELRKELVKWKQEVTDHFEWDPMFVFPGDRDVVWKFNGLEKDATTGFYKSNESDEASPINPITSLNTSHEPELTDSAFHGFIVTSDKDNDEGVSTSSLTVSPAGHALFTGVINTQIPDDGQITYTGYCNMSSLRPHKAFGRRSFFDWTEYTHLVIRCRGDGRSYALSIGSAGSFDIAWHDAFSYVLYTRGGPHWQTYKVPFSKFLVTSKGTVQDKQCALDPGRVTSFGITVGDKINAPFNLEIDYIAVECDPLHTEEFSYEMYQLPAFYLGS